ncbi:MAG: DNA polymerase III subunit gamma/tau [Planctomycetes bacterium]|nr:DNA polymerase III subunit gamma/tau [Planctomycetota bacterium]
MSYLVLARKYRPGTFQEVAGQPAIARTLENAIKLGRIAHAYLFAGPRGVGKTSLARILARSLCCVAGPTPAPCGTCDRCLSILRGNDLDVVEIDAASNRGIDDIRALRERARVAPMRGARKLYIIDEAHQLTSEAFNALLKILEEPPAHVVFVLATTEPERVPDTIRSRCQFFEFRRIPAPEIVERLKSICASEGIEAEEEALAAIARAARGGMRDAQSLLDQVITFGAGKVAADGVVAVTGSLSPQAVRGLLRALCAGDMAALLRALDSLERAGIAMEGIADALLAEVRDLLVACASGGDAALLQDGAGRDELVELAAGLDIDRVLAMTNLLLQARRRMREHDEPRLPLETALLRMARLPATMPIGEALALLLGEPAPAAPATPRAAAEPAARAAARPAAPPAAPPLREDPAVVLERIAAEVRVNHGAMAAFLGTLRALALDGVNLDVVPADAGPRLYNLDDPKLRRAVAEASLKLYGQALVLRAGSGAKAGGQEAPPAAPSRSTVDRVRKLFDGEVID